MDHRGNGGKMGVIHFKLNDLREGLVQLSA